MGTSTIALLGRSCEVGTVRCRNVVVLGEVTYMRLGLRPFSITLAVAQAAVSPVQVDGCQTGPPRPVCRPSSRLTAH